MFQSIVFGGFVTLVFIWFWDAPIKKYNIEVEPFEGLLGDKNIHTFAGDFNGDGNSERIRCNNSVGAQSLDITHYDKDGYLTDQYHIIS